MPDKCVIYRRADGKTCLYTPQLWALLRLQRGHYSFDQLSTIARLRKGGVIEREIKAALTTTIDLEREEKKLRANPANSEQRIERYLAYHAAGNRGGCTPDEAFALMIGKDVPTDATEVRIIDVNEIPIDRTFRNALKPDLSHDLPKARDIWRQNMRNARAPKLAVLDVEYQRADETSDVATKQRVAASKQALRDVTSDPRIEAAKSCSELKAIWPPDLGPHPDEQVI